LNPPRLAALAHQLKRVGYGIEIDPGYVAVALEPRTMLGFRADVIQE
jgi:hypothetical protein